MKKVLALAATAGILATASFAFAGTIVGSKHDLSAGRAYSGSSTQICVLCHAPHNAAQSLPLWNRSQPTSTFTLYEGQNMANQSFADGFTSDSTSLFCMSCHDGVTTISAVHNSGVLDGTGNGAVHPMAAGKFYATALPGGVGGNLGTDLRTTHPINFPVDNDSQGDLNYTGTNTFMGPVSAQAIAAGVPASATTYPLFKATPSAGQAGNTVNGQNRGTSNNYLECGSCHAVHDSGFSPFLRATMNKSTLCLGCHNK